MFVSLGRPNEMSCTVGASRAETYFFHSIGGWKPKIKVPTGSVSPEVCLLAVGHLLSVGSHGCPLVSVCLSANVSANAGDMKETVCLSVSLCPNLFFLEGLQSYWIGDPP